MMKRLLFIAIAVILLVAIYFTRFSASGCDCYESPVYRWKFAIYTGECDDETGCHFYKIENTGLKEYLGLKRIDCCAASVESKQKVSIQTDTLPTLLIYGELLPAEYTDGKDSTAARQFGFNLKRVADCDVTQVLIDSVNTINRHSDTIMQARYGQDWKQRFEKQTKLKMAIPSV